MKVCLRPALWSPLVLVLSLSQCVVEPPPMLPPGANSGYSLDAGPNLRRNRQDTRYLETTQPPPLPNPENGTVAGPPAPTYETPAIFDNSASPNSPSTPPAPDTAATTPPPTTDIPPTVPETPPAPTTPKPSTPEQLPFGLPVPSKKGFVYSPFDKTQLVDVRGIPPGKKVRCPYTSKIFLVP
jgi:hypothetical protein